MSAIPHHTSDPVCALCEIKLATAHQSLQDWFRNVVKPANPDAHVSWANRDQADQEAAFSLGTTKLHFPDSRHNKLPSEALDLFQIDDQGKAQWPRAFFEKINAEMTAAGLDFIWGANFPALGDLDHFQLQ